jgi:hypothetical protein
MTAPCGPAPQQRRSSFRESLDYVERLVRFLFLIGLGVVRIGFATDAPLRPNIIFIPGDDVGLKQGTGRNERAIEHAKDDLGLDGVGPGRRPFGRVALGYTPSLPITPLLNPTCRP